MLDKNTLPEVSREELYRILDLDKSNRVATASDREYLKKYVSYLSEFEIRKFGLAVEPAVEEEPVKKTRKPRAKKVVKLAAKRGRPKKK